MKKARSVYKMKVLTSTPYRHAVKKLNFQPLYHFFVGSLLISDSISVLNICEFRFSTSSVSLGDLCASRNLSFCIVYLIC